MVLATLLLLHLLGFAAFVGGAVAQQQLMKRSALPGVPPAVRDAYERASAAVSTKVELTGLFLQVLSGVGAVVVLPGFLQQHWLHAKLTVVLVLLVLAHVEMINARKVVKARQARGEAANEEIAARKRRLSVVGTAVDVLIGIVILLATVLRTAF
jgi:uncharacterized membrane protein